MLEVSVVLPVYNCERYIEESINSILSQKFDSFELIVVNDGSTDKTASILDTYKDNKLTILTNNENQGLVFSLNLAINNSKGQFICRMDADDICDEYRLSKQYQFLITNPNIDVIGCQGFNIDEKGSFLNKKSWRQNKLLIEFYCLLGENPVGHPFSMIRKSKIIEVGGYREQYFRAEDKDLWLRILSSGGHFANLKDTLLCYRIHPNQITDSKTQVEKISRDVIRDFYKTIGIKSSLLEDQSLETFLNFNNYRLIDFPFCFGFISEVANKMKYNLITRYTLIYLYFLFFFKRLIANMQVSVPQKLNSWVY